MHALTHKHTHTNHTQVNYSGYPIENMEMSLNATVNMMVGHSNVSGLLRD